jgi:hypothetical protein
MDLIAWGFTIATQTALPYERYGLGMDRTIVVISGFPYQWYGMSGEQDEAQVTDPTAF